MAAAAEPWGQILASEVHSGEKADDPLYGPLINRVRQMLGRCGLLYVGDSKMAALETRAEMVAHKDSYLMPLPMTQWR
jgi:transposase